MMPARLEDRHVGRPPERHPQPRGSRVHGQQRVGMFEGVQRLAQAAGRQHLTMQHVVQRQQHQVGVACQLHVLEPVVEHVHGAVEFLLGHLAGTRPPRMHQHAAAGQLARQHERLVAALGQRRAHVIGVAHDDDVA